MLAFNPIRIEDKDTIQSFFNSSVFRNCDFSFSNIFSWRHLYNTTFAVKGNEFLFIRFQTSEDMPGYLFPLGNGDLKTAFEILMADAAERGNDFRLYAITSKMFEQIEQIFPGRFSFETDRDWYEYLYPADDLIRLVGKKYQSKRNHINKLKRTYQWEYLPITREIIPDCLQLYRRWCAENGGCNTDQSLVEECLATHQAFEHYEQLGLTGGALRINGEILAYSYGQALTVDTFGVHAEKSLYEIDGGFTMMNQQFAEHNCAAYRYINREEDLGIDSLRQAKLSYHPEILLEKGLVKLI
ncbi:hypothetical protein FACS189413_00590 [Bacteroidia bacterium]|nr:hypothetical protein FACS189413_00590 [Bacteroidia bacterium]